MLELIKLILKPRSLFNSTNQDQHVVLYYTANARLPKTWSSSRGVGFWVPLLRDPHTSSRHALVAVRNRITPAKAKATDCC